jgi:hypothetical protein
MNVVRSVLPTGAIATPRMMLELQASSDVPCRRFRPYYFKKARTSFHGTSTRENWCGTDLSFITETTPSTSGVRSEACH